MTLALGAAARLYGLDARTHTAFVSDRPLERDPPLDVALEPDRAGREVPETEGSTAGIPPGEAQAGVGVIRPYLSAIMVPLHNRRRTAA